MNIIRRFKKLSLWNKIGTIGAFASLIGLILIFIPNGNKVKSNNQSGGITAGHIDNINIITIKETEQKKKDSQTALIYQSEILHFMYKFRTCLHWTLPLGNDLDKEINNVFHYGPDLTSGYDLNKITEDDVKKIFTKYNFAEVMPNYIGESNFKPTGFNNILGILEYFNQQLEKHLNKYGSSISTDLSTRIEYMQRMTQSTITCIRIDLGANKRISNPVIDSISSLILLMRDDYLLMNNYTKNISGGYPISFGTVTKADEKDGEMIVETQFSGY